MPEPENPVRRALYDHEVEFHHEEPHPGRRHRQIADWGGDELFARMPRRRSSHDGGPGQRRFAPAERDAPATSHRHATATADARGGAMPASDAHGGSVRGSDEHVGSARFSHGAEAGRAGAPDRIAPTTGSRGTRRRPADDWGLDLPSDPLASTPVDAPAAPDRESADPGWVLEFDERDLDAAGDAPEPAGVPVPHNGNGVAKPDAGRRTVVIGRSTGPGMASASRSQRRPPRTVAERIGGQPERMVAWAFALGVLLILIAIATAHV